MFTRLSQQTTMCWEQPNGNKSLGQKLDKQQDFHQLATYPPYILGFVISFYGVILIFAQSNVDVPIGRELEAPFISCNGHSKF